MSADYRLSTRLSKALLHPAVVYSINGPARHLTPFSFPALHPSDLMSFTHHSATNCCGRFKATTVSHIAWLSEIYLGEQDTRKKNRKIYKTKPSWRRERNVSTQPGESWIVSRLQHCVSIGGGTCCARIVRFIIMSCGNFLLSLLEAAMVVARCFSLRYGFNTFHRYPFPLLATCAVNMT